MDCRGRGRVRHGGDSPGVVLVLLLMAITLSQLPRTSHCMMEVISKNSNTNNASNWCNGGIGQCQLLPQEPFMRDMVELEGGSRMVNDNRVSKYAVQKDKALHDCERKKPYFLCLPLNGGGHPDTCGTYKRNCHG